MKGYVDITECKNWAKLIWKPLNEKLTLTRVLLLLSWRWGKLCSRLNGDTICDKAPKLHIIHNITLNLATTQETEEKFSVSYCHKYSFNKLTKLWLGATITSLNIIKICVTVNLRNIRIFFQGAFLCQR